MITIHHLGISQSDRVVWLMEELGLPYKLKWYDRGEDFLAPPEYRALHPAATSPIIEDGDLMLAESTAIVEYISQRYGEGKLSVSVSSPDYSHYLYWMQFNNNLQSALFLKLTAKAIDAEVADKNPLVTTNNRRYEGLYKALEQRLGESPYLAGEEFSCADIMSIFGLVTMPMLGARTPDDSMPNTQTYLKRVTSRPAYQKAMALAGPSASRPSS
jgi:glutathione S-transferase